MDPLIRVPPVHYGGIERVIYDIARKYTLSGHDVTLMCSPDSISPGKLIPFGKVGEDDKWSKFRNTAIVNWTLHRTGHQFDIVHNFGRLAYLCSVLRSSTVKIQTYMRKIWQPNIKKTVQFKAQNLHYTAVSDFIAAGGACAGGNWNTIYNCTWPEDYNFSEYINPATAPLVFLGRIERCKGAHSAIKAAKIAKRELIIAGNLSDLPEEKQYWEDELKPEIDGNQIKFIGKVNTEQKNKLLGSAAAMLLPIEWDEPFPIVLPEAYMCGTPIIAFPEGGVPEGIEHGKTGFICKTSEEMADYIDKLPEISRKACRDKAMGEYSAEVIANNYLNLYKQALNHK